MSLTKDLLRLAASYLIPSEQVVFLQLHDDNIASDRQYWVNQARDSLGISQEQFDLPIPAMFPMERYLELYTKAGHADYGSEEYTSDLDLLIRSAIIQEDRKLVAYLYSKMVLRSWTSLEKSQSYLAHCEAGLKGISPNLQRDYEDYLLCFPDHGIFRVCRAVIHHDYKDLKNLIRTKGSGTYYIQIAYNESIRNNDVNMVQFLSRENFAPDMGHLLEVIENGSDEIFRAILRAIDAFDYFRPEDWQRAYNYAQSKGREDRAILIKEKINRE
jgi:hypothetical protein